MVYAIIPARGGSKGVPNKNIKLLGGYPLIAYTIAAAKMSRNISRVIVSTDSEQIALTARKYKAEVPFMRPVELAQDNSADIDFVLHSINWFKRNEGRIPDYMVHLRPTTPLRDPAVIDEAVQKIEACPEATSLRSGHPAAESPFKWFLLDEQGFFNGISPGYSNDSINTPRQAFADVYIPNGYVDILKMVFIEKSRLLHGNKMVGFVSPACVEVDNMEDFEFLEFELQKGNSLVFDYLKTNFPKENR